MKEPKGLLRWTSMGNWCTSQRYPPRSSGRTSQDREVQLHGGHLGQFQQCFSLTTGREYAGERRLRGRHLWPGSQCGAQVQRPAQQQFRLDRVAVARMAAEMTYHIGLQEQVATRPRQ